MTKKVFMLLFTAVSLLYTLNIGKIC